MPLVILALLQMLSLLFDWLLLLPFDWLSLLSLPTWFSVLGVFALVAWCLGD